MSNERIGAALARSSLALGSALAFAILVGGCSADVTRFDFPMFGLTDKGNETGSLPPTPSESVARRNPSYEEGSAGPPRGAGLGDANRGFSAPPSNYSQPAPYSSPSTYSSPPPYTTGSGPGERVASARDYVPPAPSADPAPGTDRYAGRPMDRARAAARGETIQVQQGDTLYGICQALWRVRLSSDRHQWSGAWLLHQTRPAVGAARRRAGHGGRRGAGRPCTVGPQFATAAAHGCNAGGARRLGGAPHLEAGRVDLWHRPPARRDACPIAAGQRHHRADPRARRHRAVRAGQGRGRCSRCRGRTGNGAHATYLAGSARSAQNAQRAGRAYRRAR